jgi:hypothetical protein
VICHSGPAVYRDSVSEQSGPISAVAQFPQSEYVVVLRAPSAARFLPEEGWELVLNVPDLDVDGVRVRTFTRWVDEQGKQLPQLRASHPRDLFA